MFNLQELLYFFISILDGNFGEAIVPHFIDLHVEYTFSKVNAIV